MGGLVARGALLDDALQEKKKQPRGVARHARVAARVLAGDDDDARGEETRASERGVATRLCRRKRFGKERGARLGHGRGPRPAGARVARRHKGRRRRRHAVRVRSRRRRRARRVWGERGPPVRALV